MADSITSETKRLKFTGDEHQPLLQGLPDHLAHLCLSLVHPSFLYSVCSSWRRLIYSPSFPPSLSLYALLSQTHSKTIHFFSFDPISSNWDLLPPPPPDPPLRLLLRHPSFISRNLPVQSVSVSGNLVLLAATTRNFLPALPRPLFFNPSSKSWAFGPPLAAPRRWCATGTLRGAVYVASGIGSQFSSDTARSLEKWDLNEKITNKNDEYLGWEWEKKSGLKDGRFSREAIDGVGWRGKLCMVNVKGDAAKDGVIYDVEKDMWEKMPVGMISGWRGPVAAMDEEVMYAVDEGKGVLRKYDPDMDAWEDIVESEKLRGAEQMAAGGGRASVVCGGRNNGIVVVDVVGSPPGRLWVVDTPTGFEALAVHILPRMSRLDF